MLGWGVSNFLLAIASRRIGAFRTTLWYQLISLVILAFLSVFLLRYASISTYTLFVIAFTAFTGIVGLMAYNKGMQVGNVPIVATVSSAYGAITAVLGFLLLKEALSLPQALCIGLIVIGTVAVSFHSEGKKGGRKDGLGVGYALVAMVSWALWIFLIGYLVKTIGWFAASLYPLMFTIVFMFLYGGAAKTELTIKCGIVPLLLLIAVIDTVAFLSYNLGVTYSYTDIVAPITAASPVITVLLALVLLKERLTLNQKLGVLLVLVSIVALAMA